VANVPFIFGTSPIQNLKRKSEGDMAYYVPPTWKSGGDTSPTKLRPCTGGLVLFCNEQNN